jgi:hypothetical protein
MVSKFVAHDAGGMQNTTLKDARFRAAAPDGAVSGKGDAGLLEKIKNRLRL